MSLSQDEAEELELLELEELEAASKPKPSELESALLGAQSSAMFGFGDELAGRVAQGVDFAQGLFGESPTEMAAKAKAEGIDIGNIPSSREELYKQARDESRGEFSAAQQANPKSFGAGGLAGGLLLPGLGAGAGLGKIAAMGAAQGAAYGAGASEEEDMKGVALDALVGGGIGGAGGVAGKVGGDLLAKGIGKAGRAIGDLGGRLRGSAEKLAVKATGATGKQAGEFADDAGRELLDRKLVRFMDTPSKIAGRVGDAADDAGRAIGKVIDDLDSQGVMASVDNVAAGLQSQIDELAQVPGNERVIRQLQGELDNLYERGDSLIPVSQSEKAKRAFQGQTNYASPEAEKTASGIVARGFKEESERAALEASPELASKLTEEKKLFGLLKPIQSASEKRANTLNQSPFGGLGDTAAAAVGASGGGPMAIAAAAGRRLVAPRLSSMMAVSTDAIANVARMAPEKLGKFAPVLQRAAERGSQAVAATNFMLQQSDPEYRAFLKKIQDEEDQSQ